MRLTALLKSRRNTLLAAALLLLFIVAAVIVFIAISPTLDFLNPQNSKPATSSAKKVSLPVAKNRVMGPVKKIAGSTVTFEGVGESKSYQINLADFSKIKDSQNNKSLKIVDIVVGETIAVWSDQEIVEGLIPSAQIVEVTVFTDTNLQKIDTKNIPRVGENAEGAKNQTK